jgi:hypothetical protein
MLGWYGKQDYDPIVFAMRDSSASGLMIILSLMFWAADSGRSGSADFSACPSARAADARAG